MADAAVLKNRTVEDALEDFLTAKKMESEAKALRVEAENEIVGFLGARDEGSKTHKLNGFKVDIKGAVNRKVDWEKFHKIVDELRSQDESFSAPSKMKEELDVTGLNWYKENHPSIYARLAIAITATPGKIGVSVVRTE